MLVEGARRVGKSTVVEEFARREYRSYILVYFAEASRDVRELFDDVSDLDYLFLQLQLRYSARLFDGESLIIFDEVQMCPRVRQAVKQLVRDGRYDYIETGSLVLIHRNTRDILIPSDEERARMRPMDLEEFLWARGGDATVPLLRQAFASRRPLGERLSRKLMRDFRLYMLVGGMPQAVDALLRTNDLLAVDDVKRVIVDLYEEDMHKISLSDKLPVNLGMVYENVVAQELTAHGRRLFYHTWPKPGTTRNYKIDFIVPDGKKVSPVEVKSSNYRTHASPDAFCGKYSSRVGRRYLVYTKDLDRDGAVDCIPTYMSAFL
ncbi:AAA family ATPase [Bifidobacterium pseudocatenulatum]|nr:AAA family ATPase [Bifidobacterium pseudocatenulatum]MCG4622628.1 AAA family ATPase [Bifidobacterium pseudocatenulatum]MCG4629589.1 AAA family ATPase [Bifidobacterium pseudocatenulatum]MCQ4965074.1 AAA family ATPase [Bifidobacterium pseudocatenulatum]MCQ4974322.1 AAA family ATPase [Bifidobacterium pseudocatenulatum]MCQ4976286.1 AAA family ATPase [Bifidobacterium pseudocatenulatum]